MYDCQHGVDRNVADKKRYLEKSEVRYDSDGTKFDLDTLLRPTAVGYLFSPILP
jgi:hypothetical protein